MKRTTSFAMLMVIACIASTMPGGDDSVFAADQTQQPSKDTDVQGPQAPASDEETQAPLTAETLRARLESFAASIAAASPPAHVDSRKARDEAALKLARLAELIDSGEEYVAWGVFDPAAGYDLKSYKLWAVSPLACIKINLSLFAFSGQHSIRFENDLVLLELNATLRGGLEPEDFPAPFWKDQTQWHALLDTQSIVLMFRGETLLAALVKKGDTSNPSSARAWEADHAWTDAKGQPKPRASRFGYLFSPENPEAPGVRTAYDTLLNEFSTHNCLSCHTRGDSLNARSRFIFDVPNDAIAVRNLLPDLLDKSELPEGDPHKEAFAAFKDANALSAMNESARAFQEVANNALAYEAARRAAKIR